MSTESMACDVERNGSLASADEPVLVRAADVVREPLAWLWPGRMPGAKVTMVVGDPGLGKSLVALDIAARVTRGLPWPDGGQSGPATGLAASAAVASGCVPAPGGACAPPGKVVILTAQDGLADTVRPRVEASGADLGRVVLLRAVRGRGEGAGRGAERPFSMASDLGVLERALAETGDVRLVIIDPLSAYLGAGDVARAAEVRGVLTLLRGVAERWQCAVLAVSHLNKNLATQAIYRAAGNLALVAAARAVWVVARDAEQAGRHLLLPVKCNLSSRPDGLAYRIVDSPALPGTPAIAWEPEPVRLPPEEGLAADTPAGRQSRSEREEAGGWLRNTLAKGPVSVSGVRRRAREAGFSWQVVKRAKLLLPIIHGPREFGGPWQWRLDTVARPVPKEEGPAQRDQTDHTDQTDQTDQTDKNEPDRPPEGHPEEAQSVVIEMA